MCIFYIKACHESFTTWNKNKLTLINKTLKNYLIIDKQKIDTISIVDVLFLHDRLEKQKFHNNEIYRSVQSKALSITATWFFKSENTRLHMYKHTPHNTLLKPQQ